MQGVISGIPAGNYRGRFLGIRTLHAQPPYPMTGKGGRQWTQYRFEWEIDDGTHAGQIVTRDTSTSDGPKSAFRQMVVALLGRTPSVGEKYDLTCLIGERYVLTVGPKLNPQGVATTYLHVTTAIKM